MKSSFGSFASDSDKVPLPSYNAFNYYQSIQPNTFEDKVMAYRHILNLNGYDDVAKRLKKEIQDHISHIPYDKRKKLKKVTDECEYYANGVLLYNYHRQTFSFVFDPYNVEVKAVKKKKKKIPFRVAWLNDGIGSFMSDYAVWYNSSKKSKAKKNIYVSNEQCFRGTYMDHSVEFDRVDSREVSSYNKTDFVSLLANILIDFQNGMRIYHFEIIKNLRSKIENYFDINYIDKNNDTIRFYDSLKYIDDKLWDEKVFDYIKNHNITTGQDKYSSYFWHSRLDDELSILLKVIKCVPYNYRDVKQQYPNYVANNNGCALNVDIPDSIKNVDTYHKRHECIYTHREWNPESNKSSIEIEPHTSKLLSTYNQCTKKINSCEVCAYKDTCPQEYHEELEYKLQLYHETSYTYELYALCDIYRKLHNLPDGNYRKFLVSKGFISDKIDWTPYMKPVLDIYE